MSEPLFIFMAVLASYAKLKVYLCALKRALIRLWKTVGTCKSDPTPRYARSDDADAYEALVTLDRATDYAVASRQ